MSTQARYKQIYQELRREIADGVFAGGERLPTEQALADRFGVNRQTLLKALNIMKIEGIIRSEQGKGTYVNAPAASRHASGHRKIVFIASNLQDSFAHQVMLGVEQTANDLGFSLITCNTRNDSEREAEYLRRARSGGVAGIVLIPYFQRSRELALRIAEEMPLICIDNGFDAESIPVVTSDHFQGAYQMTAKLIALGHRRIGFVLNSFEAAARVESIRLRLEGYQKALSDHGIEFDPLLISELGPALSDMRPRDVGIELYSYPAMNRLLHLESPPSAVILLWDELAPGAMAAIRDTRREIPRDISLAGFNDEELCTLISPPLSSVHQDGEEIGATAVRLLAARIDGGVPIPEVNLIESRFMQRGSIASYQTIKEDKKS